MQSDELVGTIVKDAQGNSMFQVLFNVQNYLPEEISIQTESNKLYVSARQLNKQGSSTVSREFTREVDLPDGVDPNSLQCTIRPDGILAVEAPMATPKSTMTTLPIIRQMPPMTSTSVTSSSKVESTFQPRTASPTWSESAISSGYQPRQEIIQSPNYSVQQHASTSSPRNPQNTRQGYTEYSGQSSNPVVTAEAGKFKLEIDVEDYNPEKFTIKTQDNTIFVKAIKEQRTGNTIKTRELNQTFTVPDSVDPQDVKAFFNGNKLIIEAPYNDINTQGRQIIYR